MLIPQLITVFTMLILVNIGINYGAAALFMRFANYAYADAPPIFHRFINITQIHYDLQYLALITSIVIQGSAFNYVATMLIGTNVFNIILIVMILYQSFSQLIIIATFAIGPYAIFISWCVTTYLILAPRVEKIEKIDDGQSLDSSDVEIEIENKNDKNKNGENRDNNVSI